MNSFPTFFGTVVCDRKTLLGILAFIFFLGSTQISSAQGNDLQTAASRIDKLIAKKNRSKVIVTDFIGPKDAVTEYGQAVAGELSSALAKTDPNLDVIPRTGQTYTFGNSGSENLKEGSAAWFLGRSVGAEVVVTGNLRKRPDGAELNIRVWDVPATRNRIGAEALEEFTVGLSISPEQRVQFGSAIPQDPPQGFRLTAGKNPSGHASYPACLDCPVPAGLGKAEVNLLITISEKGVVTNVELVSALNQKTGEKVRQAAMKWRFRPARGPDGQPIGTQIPFEVSLGNKLN